LAHRVVGLTEKSILRGGLLSVVLFHAPKHVMIALFGASPTALVIGVKTSVGLGSGRAGANFVCKLEVEVPSHGVGTPFFIEKSPHTRELMSK
jgi:hypothetical protein